MPYASIRQIYKFFLPSSKNQVEDDNKHNGSKSYIHFLNFYGEMNSNFNNHGFNNHATRLNLELETNTGGMPLIDHYNRRMGNIVRKRQTYLR